MIKILDTDFSDDDFDILTDIFDKLRQIYYLEQLQNKIDDSQEKIYVNLPKDENNKHLFSLLRKEIKDFLDENYFLRKELLNKKNKKLEVNDYLKVLQTIHNLIELIEFNYCRREIYPEQY